MPLPRWLARFNRRVMNPREVRSGKRPVLTHVGRSSGRVYRTPLDAHRIDGGYVFFPLYGARSDWVRNILAVGTARLTAEGEDVELDHPRVVARDDVRELLPVGVKLPPGLLRVRELLRMDLVT